MLVQLKISVHTQHSMPYYMVTFIKYPMSEFRNDWADLLQLRSDWLKNDLVGQNRRRAQKV